MSCHLERHCILELIQEHLELPDADDKVRKAELILYIPAKRSKLQSLLHMACSFVLDVMVVLDLLLTSVKLLISRDVCTTTSSRYSNVRDPSLCSAIDHLCEYK